MVWEDVDIGKENCSSLSNFINNYMIKWVKEDIILNERNYRS